MDAEIVVCYVSIVSGVLSAQLQRAALRAFSSLSSFTTVHAGVVVDIQLFPFFRSITR